jgi:hypothetical protein
LALASPTSGGRSVGIVLSRTQATEKKTILIDNSYKGDQKMAAINGKAMYSVHFAFWTLTDNRRHVTSWKVSGTIPDEITELFNFTMALGLTQPITDMSTRNLPGR